MIQEFLTIPFNLYDCIRHPERYPELCEDMLTLEITYE